MRQLAEIAKISNPYLSQVERGSLQALGRGTQEHRQRPAHLGGDDVLAGRPAGRLERAGTKATTGSSMR